MTNPFKRFFGGMVIGICLAIPFFQPQGEPFGSQFVEKIHIMSPASSDVFLVLCMTFLGIACACVGAMATRKTQPSFVSPSTFETFRQRRQRRMSHYLLR